MSDLSSVGGSEVVYFSHIIGHKRQISTLEGMIHRGTVPQGLVLAGPEHVGKSTIAMSFASAVLGSAISDLSRHPDFILLTPTMKESGAKLYEIEDIRDAIARLGQSAIHGTTVMIIDDANVLSTAGQNALLKTLEEPVGKTTVIFVAHHVSALLSTVLSRMVTLSFGLLSGEDAKKLAMMFPVDQTTIDERVDDVRRVLSGSLVERLKAAQTIGKREAVDSDALLLSLAIELKRTRKYSSKTLEAVLKTRERITANGNSIIALEQLAVSLEHL